MEKTEFQIKLLNDMVIILALCNVLLIGGMLNLVAVVDNGGKMPVLSLYEFEGDEHIGVTDLSKVKKPFLVDRFVIEGYYWRYAFSFGDILLYTSSFIMIIYIIRVTYLKIKYRKLLKNEKK